MVREYRKAAPGLRITLFVLTQHDKRTRHDRESHDIISAQLPFDRPDLLSPGEPAGVLQRRAGGGHADPRVRSGQRR
jgi:hypothetical protein